MKRILKYNILITCLALLTASCSSEEEYTFQPPLEGDGYIHIVSGQVGYSTRGLKDEPSVAGQCNADMLYVYQYEYHDIGGSSVNTGKLNFTTMWDSPVEHFSESTTNPYFQSDKWTRKQATLPLRGARINAFAFPSLAFTQSDLDYFNVNTSGSLQNMSLTLTGEYTPELYFGRVGVEDEDLPIGTYNGEVTGIYGSYRAQVNGADKTRTLTGKLYRIVSQINVTVSNVNPELVERMTMELSNVPTEIGLYADHRNALGKTGSDHGYLYPIVIANGAQQKEGPVVVSETTDFRKGEAKLSTFLLPSETGRSLNIHIYFKEDIFDGEDEEGNPKTFRDKSFEVRPPKSYYIPAEVADAYFSQEPLCVYNVTDNQFFSFSNVRVNINGDFDNFFPDRVEVDMDVEICSRYDKEHNYGDIDYSTK